MYSFRAQISSYKLTPSISLEVLSRERLTYKWESTVYTVYSDRLPDIQKPCIMHVLCTIRITWGISLSNILRNVMMTHYSKVYVISKSTIPNQFWQICG